MASGILSTERSSIFRLQPSTLRFRGNALCTHRFVAVAFNFLAPEDALFIKGVMIKGELTCSFHKPSRPYVVGLERSSHLGGWIH